MTKKSVVKSKKKQAPEIETQENPTVNIDHVCPLCGQSVPEPIEDASELAELIAEVEEDHEIEMASACALLYEALGDYLNEEDMEPKLSEWAAALVDEIVRLSGAHLKAGHIRKLVKVLVGSLDQATDRLEGLAVEVTYDVLSPIYGSLVDSAIEDLDLDDFARGDFTEEDLQRLTELAISHMDAVTSSIYRQLLKKLEDGEELDGEIELDPEI